MGQYRENSKKLNSLEIGEATHLTDEKAGLNYFEKVQDLIYDGKRGALMTRPGIAPSPVYNGGFSSELREICFTTEPFLTVTSEETSIHNWDANEGYTGYYQKRPVILISTVTKYPLRLKTLEFWLRKKKDNPIPNGANLKVWIYKYFPSTRTAPLKLVEFDSVSLDSLTTTSQLFGLNLATPIDLDMNENILIIMDFMYLNGSPAYDFWAEVENGDSEQDILIKVYKDKYITTSEAFKPDKYDSTDRNINMLDLAGRSNLSVVPYVPEIKVMSYLLLEKDFGKLYDETAYDQNQVETEIITNMKGSDDYSLYISTYGNRLINDVIFPKEYSMRSFVYKLKNNNKQIISPSSTTIVSTAATALRVRDTSDEKTNWYGHDITETEKRIYFAPYINTLKHNYTKADIENFKNFQTSTEEAHGTDEFGRLFSQLWLGQQFENKPFYYDKETGKTHIMTNFPIQLRNVYLNVQYTSAADSGDHREGYYMYLLVFKSKSGKIYQPLFTGAFKYTNGTNRNGHKLRIAFPDLSVFNGAGADQQDIVGDIQSVAVYRKYSPDKPQQLKMVNNNYWKIWDYNGDVEEGNAHAYCNNVKELQDYMLAADELSQFKFVDEVELEDTPIATYTKSDITKFPTSFELKVYAEVTDNKDSDLSLNSSYVHDFSVEPRFAFITNYRGRLVGVGDPDNYALFFYSTPDIEDYFLPDNSIILPIDTDEYYTGLEVLNGAVYVFTNKKIMRVSEVRTNVFSVQTITNSLGNKCPKALVRAYNNLFFPSDQGIVAFTGASYKIISEVIKDKVVLPDNLTELDGNKYSPCFIGEAVYFQDNIVFLLPYGEAGQALAAIAYDLKRNLWRSSDTIQNMRHILNINDTLYFADDIRIYQMEKCGLLVDSFNDMYYRDPNSVPFILETKNIDFGIQTLIKELRVAGYGDVHLDVYIDKSTTPAVSIDDIELNETGTSIPLNVVGRYFKFKLTPCTQHLSKSIIYSLQIRWANNGYKIPPTVE